MERKDLESLFTRAREIKALVIGDLMLDEYLWGKAERISPEAPVQVVDITREDLRLGGAGNVVNNLVALAVRWRYAASSAAMKTAPTCAMPLPARELIWQASSRTPCAGPARKPGSSPPTSRSSASTGNPRMKYHRNSRRS